MKHPVYARNPTDARACDTYISTRVHVHSARTQRQIGHATLPRDIYGRPVRGG